MRNVLTSPDATAQAAGSAAIAESGNAVDGVVCAMLAGATLASPAALLGSGVVLVAGAGVGAFMVDGRARAPGPKNHRPQAPTDPPRAWRAAVPGLLEGALTAHNRFGTIALGGLARIAAGAALEHAAESERARVQLLEMLPRTGMTALDRLGIRAAIMETAGPAAGGVFAHDDLATLGPEVVPLREIAVGSELVLLAPHDRPFRTPPPPLPAIVVATAVAADVRGVIACAVWAVPEEAVTLPTSTGLSLAALSNAPTKGVPRRRPGSALPIPIGAAFLRSAGRVWAGVSVSGEGDVERWRDRALAQRLGAVGLEYPAEESAGTQLRGAVSWVLRDVGDEVRASAESHGG